MTVSENATRSSVAASTSVVQLLARNENRLMAIIFNDGTANLFVALGAATQSGTTDFTYKVAAGGTLELAISYTGVIQGVWDAANGSARITEMVG